MESHDNNTPAFSALSSPAKDAPTGFSQWAFHPSPWANRFPSAPAQLASKADSSQSSVLYSSSSINITRTSDVHGNTIEPSSSVPHDRLLSEGKSHVTSTSELSQAFHPHHSVSSRFQPSRDSPILLSSLDFSSMSEAQALFYFGILSTQALLLPRFLFSTGKNKMWGVKLTFYGHSIIKSHAYLTKQEAKVDACREALKQMKSEFLDWHLPQEPSYSMVPPGWNWVEILRDFCVHNGAHAPKYTKYFHDRGFRHEVEVLNKTFFGVLKYYPGEHESLNAAAHFALYSLMTNDGGINCEIPGPFCLKQCDEALLKRVPYASESMKRNHLGASNTRDNSNHVSKRSRRARQRKIPSSSDRNKVFKNANVQPLERCRLSSIEVPIIEETGRWNVTPKEISGHLQGLETNTAQLIKICDLLSLECPQIRVERLDGQLTETEGEYSAGAYFKNDPFLTRAGAVGQINAMTASKTVVEEACAKKVVEYLISMVEEDFALEDKATEERNNLSQWPNTTK